MPVQATKNRQGQLLDDECFRDHSEVERGRSGRKGDQSKAEGETVDAARDLQIYVFCQGRSECCLLNPTLKIEDRLESEAL